MRTILLLAIFLARSISAQTEAPWLLDDETRVARRFDPELAAERAVAAGCAMHGCYGRIVVEGQRNPELFMPWELMSHVSDAYHPDPDWVEVHRYVWSSRSELPASPAFWDQLYEAAKELIETDRRIFLLAAQMQVAHELDRPAIQKQITEVIGSRCWQRAEALATARLVFGRCAFDRFLYEAIAPGKFVAPEDQTAETMLSVGEGCW
jgi:hypothetical protein